MTKASIGYLPLIDSLLDALTTLNYEPLSAEYLREIHSFHSMVVSFETLVRLAQIYRIRLKQNVEALN